MLYNDRNYANCTNTNCVTSGRSDTVGDQNFCDVLNAFVAMNTAGGNIRYRVEDRESGLFQRVPLCKAQQFLFPREICGVAGIESAYLTREPL